MGHIRLGKIPKSRKWRTVVQLVTRGAGPLSEDVDRIAAATLDAAGAGLEKARDDPGLRYTFYLLTQIVLAARESDWRERLARFRIDLDEDSTLLDLTAETQAVIDDYLSLHGRPTDVSEMAQQAAGEALMALAGPSAATLFGGGGEELRTAIRELSTRAGFARLGQSFFGGFMARFLNFYLSRITAAQVGNDRLPHVEDLSTFDDSLRTHCEQSARIVHDFCGQWYTLREFKEGINLHNTSGFVAVALQKLRDEMGQQRAEI